MADDDSNRSSDPNTPSPSPARYAPVLYPPPTTSSKAKYFDTFTSSSSPSPPPGTLSASERQTNTESASLQARSGAEESRPQQPTLKEASKTIRWQDFKSVHTYPGVRESLLMGIGAGFGAGGLRFLFTGGRRGVLGSVQQATNWAVGTFCFVGWANFEFFHYRRRLEKVSMKRVVEVMDQKRLEKEKEMEFTRAERRRAKEEEETERRRREEEVERGRWRRWKNWIS